MDDALQEILSMLRCPEKMVPVRPATSDEVARLNAAIEAGTLQTVGGTKVEEAIEDALVREGDDVAYAVRGRIPILLVEEGMRI